MEEKLDGDIGSQDFGHQGCVHTIVAFHPTVGMMKMDQGGNGSRDHEGGILVSNVLVGLWSPLRGSKLLVLHLTRGLNFMGISLINLRRNYVLMNATNILN
jgi:hypothetical protein